MPNDVRTAGRRACIGLALAAAATSAAGAQVTQPPNTREYGLDAGLTIGLGDQSSVNINLPATRARIGFFLSNDSRWSVEPAVGLNYNKEEGSNGILRYDLEAGALYHFAPPAAVSGVEGVERVSVAYVRPFVNLAGLTGGGGSEFSAGAGLGIKVPWQSSLAFRAEANAGYGFDNQAFRIGALLGLSFFGR